MKSIINDHTKRHDILVLWDATLCNPNGNPDAENQPRIDYETGLGFTTDASFKRRIRDFVELYTTAENIPNSKIFIKRDTFLGETIANAFDEAGVVSEQPEELKLEAEPVDKKAKKTKAAKKAKTDDKNMARQYLIENYWDVRFFGGVCIASSKDGKNNAGKVTGPMQVGFSRSVSPVAPDSLTITRVCGDERKGEDSSAQTMGRKEIIHYGLFRTPIFYNPNIASDAVTDRDLELFWFALERMFDMGKTSSKNLELQKCLIFSHTSPWGNARASELFGKLVITPKTEYPRSFADYDISLDENMPEGITLTVL